MVDWITKLALKVLVIQQMNEIVEINDLVPESEKIENIPPFQVGDLVQMRAKALQLVRFYRHEKDDE